ncbi:glycerol-3-phosphate acyltransferase [Hasllibacter halocynthiae]|uniref:Glycerol-3-phosphate acyltransferase n=1 Tax=Hasllibacter halocynthiae TaxID=595589 RepID=A0A2T0X1E0_9RHOB|nr:1-acyl-sn-glycerol-3-phosphate acyltransferase [Hasllibacter halocynthiae]PRY92674.1 glycerol-3-phosphate acyltransferase [Hasllibacter halocynthiae]
MGTVELPVWAFALLLGFAAVSFATNFLFPSVRWFFRRRAERIVARLNERLARPIQPFKLARRHDMIQRLAYDPEVARAAAAHARRTGVPENVAHEQAVRYAREIVPGFSATAYYTVAMRLARALTRFLYRLRPSDGDPRALAGVPPGATVVFVMNHRSNMDYVLVTHLVSRATPISYAVGEWARVFPLLPLIRALGGYFIRRNRTGNDLYRRVLARYVQMATAGGVTQAVFPEGGLTLDGRVGEPKLGILSYIAAGEYERDVFFVPVGLNYDRVLEDRLLTSKGEGGARRFRASVWAALGFTLRHAFRRTLGRTDRFGAAAVAFGAPVPLADGPGDVRALGRDLMRRIADNVPVLPVPLLCRTLEEAGGVLPEDEVEAAMASLSVRLERAGAVTRLPRQAGAAAEAALSILVGRRIVERRDGTLAVRGGAERLVAYYANSIAHHGPASHS